MLAAIILALMSCNCMSIAVHSIELYCPMLVEAPLTTGYPVIVTTKRKQKVSRISSSRYLNSLQMVKRLEQQPDARFPERSEIATRVLG